MNSNIAIKVEDVGKLYRLGEVGTGTISHDLNRWIARMRGKEDPFAKVGESNDRTTKGSSDYVWALKDVSFEVKKGEVLGIIGRNGAGKSTLLKLLSKVTQPTSGRIKVNGRIASLLEVGTGFHPEMTGRENIFLNGAIMGMTKREIRSKFDQIVDFAGVERYVDTPVKRYSSGMYVRLAFAVAAHLEPEILIVDEVLAVGDAEFQKKCLGKMKDVSVNDGRTVLFVSHNMGAMSNLCNNGLVLRNGRFLFSGTIREAVGCYLERNKANDAVGQFAREADKEIYVSRISILNEGGYAADEFRHDEDIAVEVNIGGKIPGNGSYRLLLTVLDSLKNPLFSKEQIISEKMMTLKIRRNFLVRGNYSVKTIIYIPGVTQYDQVEDVCPFTVIDSGSEFAHLETFDYGTVFSNAIWE
ncbi:polysaccharide ABC transporter ATP-binding protein [Rurimicrobium arvi]|uniref:ABC transporter ATP-binding protein n=1 Tax=Rurimicrobium arvi TaxID=2049916 RepID=A0ABP8MMM0_9BACT